MNRIMLWALLIAIPLLAVYIAAGPFLTMRDIDRAAHQNDADSLARDIDFPVLRDNLRPQVGDKLDRKLEKKSRSNPLAAIGRAYAGSVSDSVVDALITPQGIANLMGGDAKLFKKKKKKHKHSGDADQASASSEKNEAEIEWHFVSPNEFTLTQTKGSKITIFVLDRYWFKWKLTNIILPR
jgi:hypothetical protein